MKKKFYAGFFSLFTRFRRINTFLFVLILLVFTVGCEEGLFQTPITHEGQITINDDQPYAYSRDVTLQLEVEDAEEMRFSNSDGLWSDWEGYTNTKVWKLSEGTGEKIVFAEFRRRLRVSAVRKSDTIMLVGANTCSMVIENDEAIVFASEVELTLSATGSAEMRFSNSNDTESWAAAAWQPYQTTTTWTMAAGSGTRTVYGEFRDSAGNIILLNDSITVADSSMFSMIIDYPGGDINATSVGLNSSVSGAVNMRFRNDEGASWSSWEAYNTSRSWTLDSAGQRPVYGEFEDCAGNVVAVQVGKNYDIHDPDDENDGNDEISDAVELGILDYTGTNGQKLVTVSGFIYENADGIDDADYFSFTALDIIGGQMNFGLAGSKNFHVKIKFRKNPENAYGIRVWDGRIGNGESFGSEIYGEFDWGLKPGGYILHSSVNYYTSFVIEVYQHEPIVGTDKMYELEISNGLYTTYP
ncbi:MAG: hypothetical protein GY754_36680 [bacterium]|nr:hypothetical protein [bacterium]